MYFLTQSNVSRHPLLAEDAVPYYQNGEFDHNQIMTYERPIGGLISFILATRICVYFVIVLEYHIPTATCGF
ncbi:hypothetical protein SAMN05518849_12360 [Sphingobium sp. AP50]|nr:hypothetical protein SAMN05518849_12360 [Sphingobium sp. AP50]